MKWLRRTGVALCLLVLAGCGGGSPTPSVPGNSPVGPGDEIPEWTLPSDPMGLARQAGLTPDVREYGDYHVHAHLDVFLNGAPIVIPSGVGIEITDPAVEQFGTEYGGIPEEGCEQVCISPVHTHDIDGVIHVEAPSVAEFTLGQFFAEMAVRLDASCVGDYCTPNTPIAVYIDGQPQSGNPADIVLGDLQEIAIVIGTPPAVIPDSFPG